MKKNPFWFLAFFIFSIFLMVWLSQSRIVSYIDYRLYDTLISFKKEKEFTNSVVVIEIDDKSLDEFGQWPWNRILVAKLVQNVLNAKPAVLGMDVVFAERDRTSLKKIGEFYQGVLGLDVDFNEIPTNLQDSDEILASAMLAGKTVLAMFASNTSVNDCDDVKFLDIDKRFKYIDSVDNITCNYEAIAKNASGGGFINAMDSRDGVLRDTPSFLYYKDRLIPSLTIAMLMQIDPNLSLKEDTKYHSLLVNFLGEDRRISENTKALNKIYSRKDFTHVSASDVLYGRVGGDIFTGKFVLFGATAVGLYDTFIDSSGAVQSGVYYHASFLENFIKNSLVSQPFYFKEMAFWISIIVLAAVLLAIYRFGYVYGFVLLVSFMVLSVLRAFFMLNYESVYISIGYFITPMVVIFFIISLLKVLYDAQEKKQHIKNINEAHYSTISSMLAVVEGKDGETGGHVLRTSSYVRALATYLYQKGLYSNIINPNFIEILSKSAPLHDIGKVAIPDSILTKRSAFTDEEMATMRNHVEEGRKIILRAISLSSTENKFLTVALNIVYTHHEKWDGSGYPQGLVGEQIPLEGRLMALADVYDALVSKRCYKDAYSFDMAENMIVDQSGKHFDPELVKAFVAIKNEFRDIATKISD